MSPDTSQKQNTLGPACLWQLCCTHRMESLEAKLVEFYTTQMDAVRRRQLEQELQEFRGRPDALQLALQILEVSRNSVVQWFCAMILEVRGLSRDLGLCVNVLTIFVDYGRENVSGLGGSAVVDPGTCTT